MQLIGITGKAGAGKTTFSNILADKNNIGVIHADDILKQIKLKYFSMFMDKDKDGKRTKINPKLKKNLYSNKIIFNLLMKLRAKLINKPLLSEIERLEAEGKETILIDDIFIRHQKIYDRLSMVFIIDRPYAQRKKAIIKRDAFTLEEAVAVDVADFKGNYKEISQRRNTIKIINNGTEEELRQKAEEIYKQYFMNFRNRYKEEPKDNNKRKETKTLNKKKVKQRNERE